MKTHEIPRGACPGCGVVVTAAVNAQLGCTDAPRPGDLAICSRCEAHLQFSKNLSLVVLSEREYQNLSSLEWMMLVCARKEVHESNVFAMQVRVFN
jgi:hypothetical protein